MVHSVDNPSDTRVAIFERPYGGVTSLEKTVSFTLDVRFSEYSSNANEEMDAYWTG